MLIGWQEHQLRVEPYSQRTCAALVYDPLDPLQHSETTPETGFFGPGWGDAASVTQDAGMTPDGTPCQRGVSPPSCMSEFNAITWFLLPHNVTLI